MIWLRQLAQDFVYALRGLRARPLLTVVAVACLSGGIAANTTVFSVFNAILLRPFPFPRPEELVTLRERDPETGQRRSLAYADYLDWRAQATSFAEMGAYSGRVMAITDGEEPERVSGVLVSASLFPMLGVHAQVGRTSLPDDDRPGAEGTALVSDALWRGRYAADSALAGHAITVDGIPRVVVGVMPPGFAFPEAADLWIPMGPELASAGRDAHRVSVIARLAPGRGVDEAEGEVAAISRRLSRAYRPGEAAWTGYVTPFGRAFVGSDDRIVTTAMMGAVTFLLLIACANVANLLLVRAAGRRREIAVRVAIGAGRGRMLRQLVTEALVLGLVSGALSVPLTYEGLRLLREAIPASDPFPWYVHWSLDGPTLLYALGASLLTSALFGLAPALHATRGRLHESLMSGGEGGGAGRGGRRLQDALVVAEVALSLVCLVGASLFVKQFLSLSAVDLGYDMSRIMTLRFYLPGAAYDGARERNQVVEDILRRASSSRGVVDVTVSDLIPLDDEGGSYARVRVDGATFEPGHEPSVFYAGVTGHWFHTFDVGLVGGRDFTDQELRDGIPVAVINRSMAATFWPGEGAVGRRFQLVGDSSHTWFSVIGVAPDMRTVKLDENRSTPPTAYLPHRFVPTRDYALIARSRGDPAALAPVLRGAVRLADPSVPVFNVWTMRQVHWLSFWMYGMWGTIFAIFGAVALFLAAIGVYGVIYYSVSRRTREVGMRMALGADRRTVVILVVGEGMALAGLGILLGLVGALALTRLVSSLLIGISATDPVSFGAVALALALVALLASLIPARRAAGVDPMVALRHE
jgi:putative ABC transport system permease protein